MMNIFETIENGVYMKRSELNPQNKQPLGRHRQKTMKCGSQLPD